MKRPAAIAVGAVMLAVALALSLLIPTEAQLQSPYVTRVEVGDRVDLRSFGVTVTEARLAERLQADDWRGTTDGIWLVVELQFERALRTGGIRGGLRVGEVHYATSERPDEFSSDVARSMPGLPVATSMVFELPRSALDAPGSRDAVLRIGTDPDAFLDDVAELHIDLTALEVASSISILEPGRVAS